MNGFLVIFRAAMDDIPIRLFAGKVEAESYAKWLKDEFDALNTGEDDAGWIFPEIVGKAMSFMICDSSSPIALDIMEFRDGTPVANEPQYRLND